MYTLLTIPSFKPLPPYTSVLPTSVNDAGHVVGRAPLPEAAHAFICRGGKTTDLHPDSLPGASFAQSINAAGRVVGGWHPPELASGQSHAFSWTETTGWTDLLRPALGNPVTSVANAVSDNEIVVGHLGKTSDPPDEYRAFRLIPGASVQDIGLLSPSHRFSVATAVNNKGHAVGYSWAGSIDQQDGGAFIDKGDGPVAILPVDAYAADINNKDQVVGYANGIGGFLWSNGKAQYLGARVHPTGIADDGTIVGYTILLGGEVVAFIRRGNIQAPLMGELEPSESVGLSLDYVAAISRAKRHVVGTGQSSAEKPEAQKFAYLLQEQGEEAEVIPWFAPSRARLPEQGWKLLLGGITSGGSGIAIGPGGPKPIPPRGPVLREAPRMEAPPSGPRERTTPMPRGR